MFGEPKHFGIASKKKRYVAGGNRLVDDAHVASVHIKKLRCELV